MKVYNALQTSQQQIRNSIDTYFMPISIQPVSDQKKKKPYKYNREEQRNRTSAENKQIFGRNIKKKRSSYNPVISDSNYDASFTVQVETLEKRLICTLTKYKQGDPVNITKTSTQKGETPSKVENANPSKHIPFHRKVIKRGKTGEYAKEKVCPRENCQRAFKLNLFLGSKCFCEMTPLEKWHWHNNRKKLAKEHEAFMQDCWVKLREQNDYIRFDTPPPSIGDDYLSQAIAQLESMGRTAEQIETFKAMYQELGKA